MMRTGLLYKIIWLISLLTLLLSGCRGSTPKTEFYTLNSISNAQMDAQPISAGQPLSIGVGPVTIPEVLDRPQIVSRTGPNKLQIDEFHRWAGRLDEDFARVLAENISLMLATEQVDVYPWDVSFEPRYQVILEVQRFEGRFNQQEVFLEVFWKVIDPQKRTTLLFKKSVIKESLTATDYETLVATKSRAIAELSRLITKEINRL
jgi:uncharacterized lipoprotein YmbA